MVSTDGVELGAHGVEGEGGVENGLVDVAEVVDHALVIGVEEEDLFGSSARMTRPVGEAW